MTATAPHDAFRLAAKLAMIDAQIVIRHETFLATLSAGDLTAAKDRQAERDELLDERHALTEGALSGIDGRS